MKLSGEKAVKVSKHGVDLSIYPLERDDVGIVHIMTDEGHRQEFFHKTSTFIYYVIRGSGTFYLNGEAIHVNAYDVIMAKPGTKIYYLGKMELILVTSPAWNEADEIEVRKL